jgi:hypothetical protein
LDQLLGLLGRLLCHLSGLRLLARLRTQLLRFLDGLRTQLLRFLDGLRTSLLRLLDGLRTSLRLGSGASACLLRFVPALSSGPRLVAQRVDRVADEAARLLVKGTGQTIRGPGRPPAPSATEPQHQYDKCQGCRGLTPIRGGLSANLRSLLHRLAAQLRSPGCRLSADLLGPASATGLDVDGALRRVHAVATARTTVDFGGRRRGIAEGLTG